LFYPLIVGVFFTFNLNKTIYTSPVYQYVKEDVLLDFLWHKKERKGLCSIEIYPDGIAFVFLPDFKNPQIEIKACQFYPCDVKTEIAKTLHRIVEDHDVAGVKCNWVLHPNYYRLLLINVPNVPDSEYRSAVKWQIKDMIDFPLEEAIVDVFQPLDTIRYYQNKIYVVVAKEPFINTVVQFIDSSQMKAIAVDIRELAIRNLLSLKPVPNGNTVGFLDLSDDRSIILVFQNNNIAFSRQINYGFKNLKEEEQSSLLMLELRRSMDYCITELKQPVPNKIVIPPISNENKVLVDQFSKTLGMETVILDLNNLVNMQQPLDVETQRRCYVALGGALRMRPRKT